MDDVTGGSLLAGAIGLASIPRPMQVWGPTAFVDLPGPIRGAAASVLVLVVGAVLVWRYEAFLERSIDASMERPLASVGYGVAAHAVIAFAGVYLANQLAGVPTAGWNAGIVGVVVGLLLVLAASALGFTVVGSAVSGLWLGDRRWAGPVVGALLAGGAAAVDPRVGALLWFVVVSMGIGGPARKWLHASEGPDPSDVRRQ